jgi:hypothetical protein
MIHYLRIRYKELKMIKAGIVIKVFPETKNQYHCPVCGVEMVETDRIIENKYSFVWYKCSADKCNGQWFEKELIS